MNQIFPYSNIIIGVLVLIVGFVFHWLGQLISIINWDYASNIGLQEKEMPKEFKVYEKAIAYADVLLGWIYAFAGIGLILELQWSYKLLWFPAGILTYHSLSYWFWTGNQKRIGYKLIGNKFRVTWTTANLITGILATLMAWYNT